MNQKKIKSAYGGRITNYEFWRSRCLKIFLMVFFIHAKSLHAQFCENSINTGYYLSSGSSNLVGGSMEGGMTIKLYYHIVRTESGQNGVPLSYVEESYRVLSEAFTPHNIFFYKDCEVNYINSLPETYAYIGVSNFIQYHHTDGIDIFLYPETAFEIESGYGVATGPNYSSVAVIGRWFQDNTYPGLTNIISHEVGHVLSLFHTHYGTWVNEPFSVGGIPELVQRTNCRVAGDLCCDTEADPGLLRGNISLVDFPGCNYIDDGSQDASGENYMPNTNNIMSYSRPQCLNNFTNEQVNRMRVALDANINWLSDISIPSTFKHSVIDCNTISFSPYEISTQYNYLWSFGDGEISNLENPIHNYQIPGIYIVNLTVHGECGNFSKSTHEIVIPEPPNLSFTYLDNCPNFTFSVQNQQPDNLYFWTFSDGNNGSGLEINHTFPSNGLFSVTLTATNNCGDSTISVQNVNVDCLITPCSVDGNIIIVGQTGQNTYISSLFANGTIPYTLSGSARVIVSQVLNLNGNLIIDVPTMFRNTHWYCSPGSAIVLNATLLINQQSVLEGCDKMWKGIFNYGYTISVSGQSQISDAEQAISVGDGSKLNIVSALFKNNIVGIQAPLTNQKSISYGAVGGIRGSTFIREGLLKPLYPGQIPYVEASLKGVDFNYVDNLVVIDNDFIDIHEGIYANNTRVLIKENTFTSPNNLGISGIYIQNLVTNSNKIGDNNTFDNIPSPINVEFAILGALKISNNQITYNNSSNFVTGIRCSGLNGSNFYIDNNNSINIANGIGINIFGCQFNELEIKNNIIEVIQGNALNISWVSSKKRAHIFKNQFRTDGNHVNVWLETVKSLDFIENNLTGAARYSFRTGDATRCVYRGNQISQNGIGHSFLVGMSRENTYCCNLAPNLIMRLQGSNEMSDLRNNTITSLGLTDAIIGPQINAGNIWEGTNSNASIGATAGGATSLIDLVAASPFRYDPMQTGGRPVDIEAGGYEDEWFFDDGTHDDCGNQFNCGVLPYPGSTSAPNGGFLPSDTIYSGDTIIIIPDPRLKKCEQMMQSLLASNEFVNANRNFTADHSEWNMQLILNRWIDIYGIDFWSKCLGTVLNIDPQIKEWYDAEKERDDIRQPSDQRRIQYDNKAEEMGVIYDQLASIVYADPYDSNPAIDLLNSDLHIKMAELQNIVAMVKSESILKAQNFYSGVLNLPVRYGFLAERKLVWALEGKIYLNGIESLSSYEWSQLKSIANLCPLEIGAAVYEARNLLQLIGERDFNDDLTACKTVDPRSDDKEITDNIRVYPNPSDGRFRIEGPKDINITSVVIYNVLGIMVRSFETGEDNSFDLSGESSGIYYYQCMDGIKSIKKGKVILIK